MSVICNATYFTGDEVLGQGTFLKEKPNRFHSCFSGGLADSF